MSTDYGDTLTIVKGPCVLFTGRNGRKNAGIRVRRQDPPALVEAKGYAREWEINAFSLRRAPEAYAEKLGKTKAEYSLLLGQLAAEEHGCCDFMKSQLRYHCLQHEYPCPDVLVVRNTEGLLLLRAPNAFYEMKFCPSCGVKVSP